MNLKANTAIEQHGPGDKHSLTYHTVSSSFQNEWIPTHVEMIFLANLEWVDMHISKHTRLRWIISLKLSSRTRMSASIWRFTDSSRASRCAVWPVPCSTAWSMLRKWCAESLIVVQNDKANACILCHAQLHLRRGWRMNTWLRYLRIACNNVFTLTWSYVLKCIIVIATLCKGKSDYRVTLCNALSLSWKNFNRIDGYVSIWPLVLDSEYFHPHENK